MLPCNGIQGRPVSSSERDICEEHIVVTRTALRYCASRCDRFKFALQSRNDALSRFAGSSRRVDELDLKYPIPCPLVRRRWEIRPALIGSIPPSITGSSERGDARPN